MLEARHTQATPGAGAAGRGSRAQSVSAAVKMIPELVDAFRWNRRNQIAAVSGAIGEALGEAHPAIAKRLKAIASEELRPTPLHTPENLVDFEQARHGFDTVIMPEGVAAECRAIVQEHARHGELAAYGLAPRHKVLLHGAPGNGKTLLAEALAYELAVPFLRVKYGGLIDSHMGGTGKNLQALFDYARTAPCVLFLDEFDGIGMDRADLRDIGEVRRITNQLLISIDRLPATCMLVAATNADSLLDSALRRRFDFIIEVPAPTPELRLCCARRELDPQRTPGRDVQHLAETVAALKLSNLSAVVGLCQRIRRDLVLNNGAGIDRLLRSPEAGQ